MLSLDKTEELIKIRLIANIWNAQFNSPEKIESLLTLDSPDIIVLDENQQIALLVDIKAEKIKEHQEDSLLNLSKVSKLYLENAYVQPRFVMLVNLTNIKIFKFINGIFAQPVISLNTEEILNHYDVEFGHKTIFKFYLKTLIESWLRDLAYHWKSEIPPGTKELAKIGLLEKMKDGDTYTQDE